MIDLPAQRLLWAAALAAVATVAPSCDNDIPVTAGEQGSMAEEESHRRLTVIDVINFTREDPVGVAPGFDLDDKVSVSGETDSCGHGDFTSPDGESGIDNQLEQVSSGGGGAGDGNTLTRPRLPWTPPLHSR